MEKKQQKLVKIACKPVKPQSASKKQLLDRAHRNESTLSFAVNMWKNKNLENNEQRQMHGTKEDEDGAQNFHQRRKRLTNLKAELKPRKGRYTRFMEDTSKRTRTLELFQKVAKRVKVLNHVFWKMREYAVESGGHKNICSNIMQLKDSVVENAEEKDLLFNPSDYKSRRQFSFPKWAKTACCKKPEDRTQEELHSLSSLMRQLKDFRKYSKKMQMLLAKIVRYESFGRRRVVIRKGHLGISFYTIFSGSVGVVIDSVDEDKAFDKEKKPANIMCKGDSFGELALVRRSARSATVVCMEFTEFMVVDKEDFFKLGIDRLAQEELLFRMNYIRSLDLFNLCHEENLKEIAGGGRNIEVLSGRVIEENTTDSEYVYIIVKGHCDVLRLLDLTVQEHVSSPWNRFKRSMTIASPNSGYVSSNSGSDSSSVNDYTPQASVPGYNASTCSSNTTQSRSDSPKVKDQLKIASHDGENNNKPKDKQPSINSSFSSGFQSMTSNQSLSKTPTALSTAPVNKFPLEFYASAMKKKIPSTKQQLMPVVTTRDAGSSYARMMRQNSLKGNLGLGAYIRVDVLCQGDSFGFHSVLKEEDRNANSQRKFTLLSAGCKFIRIPKSNLQRYADEVTLEKIKSVKMVYPTDEELYQIFKRYHNWRSFREKLVDHIINYQSSMNKSVKERCAPIPRFPRINDKNYLRAESPIEHWQMLAESGQIEHTGSSLNSPWCVSPALGSEVSSKTHSITKATTSKQDNILTVQGSQRTLVLTHGGSRVNRLQVTTRSSLLRTKANKKLVASYA